MTNTRLPVQGKLQEDVKSIDNKPVYMYEAEINPNLYPPNFGDALSGKFETPTESATKPLSKSIKESFDETLFNEEFYAKNLSDILKETAYNPGWWADMASKVLAEMAHGQLPHGPGGLATKMNMQIRKYYKTCVIEPRTGYVYPMTEDIAYHDFRLRGQAGSSVDQKLAMQQVPDSLAKIWIISDTPPNMIAKNDKLKMNNNTFVCFSQEDAEKLVQLIQNNQERYSHLIENSFIPPHTRLGQIPEIAYKNIIHDYLDLLHSWDKKFDALIKRQHEYEIDMRKIAGEFGINQAGDRALNWKAHLMEELKGSNYEVEKTSALLREAGKIYIESNDDGLVYEVIGRNNKLKKGLIFWNSLSEFPKDADEIIANKNKLLPLLLDQTNKKRDTPFIRYPHFEAMEHISNEIKFLINDLQSRLDNKEEFTSDTRTNIHNDMQNIVTMLRDYVRTHPYHAENSLAVTALDNIMHSMLNANDEMTASLASKNTIEETLATPSSKSMPIEFREDNLVFTLEKKIKAIKEDSGYKPPYVGWNDIEEKYRDKILVLQAGMDYLNKKISIETFYSILNSHAEYDAGFNIGRSDTGKLVDRVLLEHAKNMFHETSINKLKTTKSFMLCDEKDKEKVIEKFNEIFDDIDFSTLDIDTIKLRNGKINHPAFSEAVHNKYNRLKDMETLAQSLVYLSHAYTYHQKFNITKEKEFQNIHFSTSQKLHALDLKLEEYIANTRKGFLTFNKDEKIMAAKAYQQFLRDPSEDNFNALKKHDAAQDNRLKKIAGKIEKLKVELTKQEDLEMHNSRPKK